MNNVKFTVEELRERYSKMNPQVFFEECEIHNVPQEDIKKAGVWNFWEHYQYFKGR